MVGAGLRRGGGEERVDIVSSIGKWKQLALEVYPTSKNLVNAANIYHIWEIRDENSLPFSIDQISRPNTYQEERMVCKPNGSFKSYEVSFSLVRRRFAAGMFTYLFVHSDQIRELKWAQKYYIKEQIFGERITAVEVISELFQNEGYSCLIGYPEGFDLGFGIHKM